SCDWGSTHVRLRLVECETAVVVGEMTDARGASAVSSGARTACERAERFEAVFVELVSKLEEAVSMDLASVPAVLSGMVTSAHGWCELPYAAAPVPLDGSGFVTEIRKQGARHLFFVSGVRTACDVMRGEETELAGLAALPNSPLGGCGETLVLLPGTHTKHVLVRDGVLADFATHMTGELYAVLQEHSVLRHSLAEAGDTIDDEAFSAGLAAAEGRFTQDLFGVRVGTLLRGDSASQSASFVNGLLLGTELGALEGERPVVLCASGRVGMLYGRALAGLGFDHRVQTVSGDALGRLAVLGHQRVFFLCNENAGGCSP
ncbi:MAG: 2-dehydro-3-deoxygalactonokinase, partial [Lentisphaeria bacterium]|nr:2-dehydro-3-deoxygalactonokinase [Lentisphaeria bacterium]